jgi:t-SNARE complex subunit (syntaxin)
LPGELLDQIEYQVKATADYVDEANVSLDKAIDLQISVRKKQCCICVLLIVLIIIIIIIVLSVVKPKVN